MPLLSRLFGRKDDVLALDLKVQASGPGDPVQTDHTSVASSPSPEVVPSGVQTAAMPIKSTHESDSPTDALFKVGERIKDIYLVEKILRGGMGVVYICRVSVEDAVNRGISLPHTDGSPNPTTPLVSERFRYQAIKSFRRELLFHGDIRERFDAEALIWVSLLPHPNIVRAWTFDRAAPSLFLEYVDGGDLRSKLGKPLPLQDAASIALQFCCGMTFLYNSAGIIHRDIKPANILIAGDGTVKITDFGIAKAFLGPSDSLSDVSGNTEVRSRADLVTLAGKIMGSLPWMSPEQFTEPDNVTVASDVYSFGVVLYEMLTGHMPYVASNSVEWIKKVFHETPVPPENATIDATVSAIVMRCLEKRPEDRFESFEQLGDALERWTVAMGWSSVIPAVITTAEMETSMTASDWNGRGYTFGQLGRHEDSYQSYLRAMTLDPNSYGAHSNLGSALMRLGRIDEGLRYKEEEASLHPTMAQAWDSLAQAYLLCKRLPEALEASRKAAELAPLNLDLVRGYALASQRAGSKADQQKAVAAVKALLDNPDQDNPRSAVSVAISFVSSGDVATGLELHQRAIEKYPASAMVWFNFGVTVHKHGRMMDARLEPQLRIMEMAANNYSRAVQLDERHILAWIYRGAIYARCGLEEKARSDWRAAITNDPNHQLAKAAHILSQHRFTPELIALLDKLDSQQSLQWLI